MSKEVLSVGRAFYWDRLSWLMLDLQLGDGGLCSLLRGTDRVGPQPTSNRASLL